MRSDCPFNPVCTTRCGARPALPLGLTGQQYDAVRGTLAFAPRREVVDGRLSWPLLTPQAAGLVTELGSSGLAGGAAVIEAEEAEEQERCVSIRILAGKLMLRELRVDGTTFLARGSDAAELLQLEPSGAEQIVCSQ
eukprot:SAG22_NODE_873_length_6721_cov_19.182395_2_plen_137_part_00